MSDNLNTNNGRPVSMKDREHGRRRAEEEDVKRGPGLGGERRREREWAVGRDYNSG